MKSYTADLAVPYEQMEVEEVVESEISLKLLEMGIMPGKFLTLLYIAPFGDPLAFKFEETMIALRKSEARLIKVVSRKAVMI